MVELPAVVGAHAPTVAHAPAPAGPADQATVRRTNLGLVLRHLRAAGPRSRARIAQDTGLNKATVSSLVTELVARGLVTEIGVERAGSVGRPGVIVQLAGGGACGIGVELNVDFLACLVLDLNGEVLFERRVAHDIAALGPEATLDEVARLAGAAMDAVVAAGATPAGLTVAVPGLVDSSAGVAALAPNMHWEGVDVVTGLRRRLRDAAFPIRAENDANLSAIAEWAMGAEAGVADLVYVTGEVGVGGGVIVAGQLLRGAKGFSGEVGHVSIGDPDQVCGCGRRGCWETTVGLSALLHDAADDDDPVHDPERDLEARLADIEHRAEAGDPRTLAALHRVGVSLGTGVALLINLFNPRVVVLGGYFAVLGRFLVEPLHEELADRVFGPGLAGTRISLSRLGFTAAVRGGAHVALESVFADPTLVPAVPAGPAPPPRR
jgi:predicted NBD/HSP70 family sugar kinase